MMCSSCSLEFPRSKKKEIEALTKGIESKTARVGELGVKLAQEENDLEDMCDLLCCFFLTN